jgi:polyhydroxyalkanoate synthesis regulator phasin
MESQINLDAQEHIEECHVIIDLQREEIEELRQQVKALKGQLWNLRQDRRYEVG